MKISIAVFDFTDCEIEQQMCARAGIQLEWHDAQTSQEIIQAAKGSDALITSYGPITREVIEALSPELKMISRTGVGVDNIDIQAATDCGVLVCNVPGYGTEVVSDHAIALTLACLRRINEQDANLRNGIWDYARTRPLGQCRGKRFGVVGMGAIGRATARKAAAMGFQVVCWSRSLEGKEDACEGFPVLSLKDLLATSHVVSIHTALTPDTFHLISQEAIKSMREDAILVNTSRGSVVDVEALAAELQRGHLWGAGLDVYESEPLEKDAAILSAPRTVLTPHAAYWSEESGVELRTRACRAAIDTLQGKMPQDCLNPEAVKFQETKAQKESVGKL